jgi:uncharacterized membrane protein YgcG
MKLLLLVVFSLCTANLAKSSVNYKHTYVHDYAHVLSEKQIDILNHRLKLFEDRTSAQLQAVLIKTVSNESNFENDTLLISGKLHFKAASNSLLYVISVEPSQQKLGVAKSMQNVFSASDTRLILESVEYDIEHVHYSGAIYKLADEMEKLMVSASSSARNDVTTRNAKPEITYILTEAKKNHTTAITVLSLYFIYLIIVYFYQKKHPSSPTITLGTARNIGRFIQSISRK